VQALHILPEEPPRMTLAGLLELPVTPDLQTQAGNALLTRSQAGPYPSILGLGIPCACVSVANATLGPAVDQNSTSQRTLSASQRSSVKSMSGYSLDLDGDAGLVPLRKRYAVASQNSQSQRMEPLARRSTLQPPNVDNTAGRRQLSKESGFGSLSSTRSRDLPLSKLNPFKPAVAYSQVCEFRHCSQVC
jgi:hypothetical protein